MYELVTHKIGKGEDLNTFSKELVRKIKNGEDVEKSKDLLFRATYVIGLGEVKKYSYMGTTYDLMPYMSIAFMKTIDKFNLEKENASFVNYYKRCINTEILWGYYGKYKNKEEWKEGYREFLNCPLSMDEPLRDKNDREGGVFSDAVRDPNNDIDNEISRIILEDAIYKALDEIDKVKGLRRSTKELYRYYIECCLHDKKIQQNELAARFNTCKSNVTHILDRYNKMLADILRKEGYSIEGK